jgi:hypothetical protein
MSTFPWRVTILVVCAISTVRAGPVPPWWIERGVIDLNHPADDHALANQGQLKHIASKAKQELDARLQGGAGVDIGAMIGSWLPPSVDVNDYAVVTVDQAKAVATLFYNRIGIPTPWPNAASGGPNHDAALVVGQIKDLCAFVWVPPSDGFPGGFVRREQQGGIEGLGLNPYPRLEKVAGDFQDVSVGQVTQQPIIVKASAGLFAMPSEKVRFAVPLLGETSGKLVPAHNPAAAGTSPREVVITNAASEASVLWRAPSTDGVFSVSARLMRWPGAPPVTFVMQVGDPTGHQPDLTTKGHQPALQVFNPLYFVP